MGKDKVDIGLIRRYIRGELTPAEMYALERQAQDDPAMMDVILGMESETEEVHGANMEDLRRRIASRTRHGRVRRLAPIQRWAIAATLLVGFSLGTLWFTQWRSFEQKPEVASTPTDSGEQRLAPYGTSESHDETASEDAVKVPQSEISVREEPKAVKQDQKRLALQTKKQAQTTDTLDQVVVVGFGRQKKMSLTGAVAEVETEKIDTPVQINERALAGRAPGIQLANADRNAASDTPTPIRIRGFSRNNTKPDTIKGKVVDGETQEPLQGVSVQLAENRRVTTDSSGRFTITGPSSMLNASLLGYELQTIKIPEKDSIILVMKPTPASLSEVVVVGYGNKKIREIASNPEPIDGWRAYNRYLKKSIRHAEGPKGTVTLTFTIDKEGSPINIQIIHTTHPALGKRAEQLVREGPKWKAGKNSERKAELQVTF